MLVYHPAFDAHHCVFRLLSILEVKRELEVDRLRLLDFVLCFPSVVVDFRLPPSFASVKKVAKSATNIYRTPLNAKSMFINLRPELDGAMACLAAANFIVEEELAHGRATRTAHPLPSAIATRCTALQETEEAFFGQVMNALLSFPLHGENGLKDRSGLMEFRYDHV